MPIKRAVMTDVHANLPALQAALRVIRAEACDAIYHTGDAIGIGPFPAECLDLLLNTPRLRFVMGNHDAWFARGLPEPWPSWMTDGELTHQRWVHAQLDPALRPVVANWPYSIEEHVGNIRLAFAHYGLDQSSRAFAPIVPEPEPSDLDRLFGHFQADIVFYGHHHPASDITGRARYVNPGSLGCAPVPVARFALMNISPDGDIHLEHRAVAYDDTLLFRAFEERSVPERQFIRSAFFGR